MGVNRELQAGLMLIATGMLSWQLWEKYQPSSTGVELGEHDRFQLFVRAIVKKSKTDSTGLAVDVVPLGCVAVLLFSIGASTLTLAELKKLEKRALSAGLLDEKLSTKKEHLWLQNYDKDPVIGLGTLRIELEGAVRKIARGHKLPELNKAPEMIDMMRAKGIFQQAEAAVLKDIISTLNGPTHGRTVDVETFQWVVDVGDAFIASLEKRIPIEVAEEKAETGKS